MAREITVPRLGWSMEEGVFRRWLVEEGARVQAGQSLFVLESDKAAQEVESLDAGILFVPPDAPRAGDVVAVGQLLGFLLSDGEAPPESRTPPAAPAAPMDPPPRPSAPVGTAAVPSSPSRPSRRVPVTPRARRKARELGVDLTSIRGSGRGGRIREEDILASAHSFQTDQTGTITFVIARAEATAFDALVSDVTNLRTGYSRGELFSRLLQSALAEYPELNAGGAIEVGKSIGLSHFSEGRIEHWAPEIPPGAIAALGIGRPVGSPAHYPLNLSFDAAQIGIETAASFLADFCDLIESPVLGLVQ